MLFIVSKFVSMMRRLSPEKSNNRILSLVSDWVLTVSGQMSCLDSLSVLFLSPQMAPDSPDLTPSPWLRSEVIQNLSPWHFLSLFLPGRDNCFNVTLQQKFSVIYNTDTDTIKIMICQTVVSVTVVDIFTVSMDPYGTYTAFLCSCNQQMWRP